MPIQKFAMGFFLAAFASSAPALADQGSSSLSEMLAAKNLRKGGAVNWIKYHQITDWSKLSERYIIIFAGESGDFLVRLRTACKYLDPSYKVSFSATAGNFTTADNLTFSKDDGFEKYCYVTAINRLEKTN